MEIALESLITTLRSHMSRLTSELSSHKTLLDELRTLREADKNTLRQKVREVDLLRQEVEKVAGEVKVLKGVVEEGLRERRERNLSQSHGEPQGHVMAVGEGEDGGNDEVERGQDGDESLNAQENAKEYEIEDIQPALAQRAILERPARGDRITINSSLIPGNAANTQRYVEDSELERISVELEERCSERSRSSSRLGSSVSSNGSHRAPSVASSVSSGRNPLIAASPPERQPRHRAQHSTHNSNEHKRCSSIQDDFSEDVVVVPVSSATTDERFLTRKFVPNISTTTPGILDAFLPSLSLPLCLSVITRRAARRVILLHPLPQT